MRQFYLSLCFFILLHPSDAATKRVLFLGNSYTYVNDLPQMVAHAAASAGDNLSFAVNAEGGVNLGYHLYDPVSLARIREGGYDYVIPQEQSMRPSQPDDWVAVDFLRNAHLLDSVINVYNPCGETMVYMTWGYRDGNLGFCDSYPWWPYECTYEVMDSLTNLRYRMAAEANHAVVSPVGAVWHYIRHHFPSINLYDADGSHPSLHGSYAAACCFFTSIFRKSPHAISYSAGLPAADVAAIKEAVRVVVFDSLLKWHIGEYDGSEPVGCPGYFVLGENLEIFPNPASTMVTIRLPNDLEQAELTIYNSTGSLVMRMKDVIGPYLDVPIEKLQAGVYYLRLEKDRNTMATGKMVLVRD